MTDLHAQFVARSRQAVADAPRLALLQDVTGRFTAKRAAAVAAVPEWDALRSRARAIKEATLARLDHYLEEFERQVIARGGRVHWAATAAQAAAAVLAIARTRGATRVVKSKSMVSEEIRLNDLLGQAGISAVESDFGEYIIQLAGEHPSHVIAPAIHKSRGEVGRLFTEKLGLPPTDDVEKLTAAARRVLRAHFAEAEIGISGANFAVAETGTIVVVENEGNGRLTTSLPPVHIVLVGIEKMIPRADDLGVFLRLLARSATGQAMTSYVSCITGPRRAGELDGPDEVHVVILDNGRSTILADPAIRETLACLRCGACQNTCPVYRHIGGHAYSAVYAGPIGALVSPFLDAPGAPPDLPFASTLCGACAEVCPVRIDIPAVLLRLRERAMDADLPGPGPHARLVNRLGMRLWAAAMRTPARYAMAFGAARLALRMLSRRGAVRWLPGPFGGWTRGRNFPAPPRKTFRQMWTERSHERGTTE